ncbi:MAG: peptidoglycan-binding domain-containing protein [Alphaproteobacteria bacterium]|jgi:hypothetical protein
MKIFEKISKPLVLAALLLTGFAPMGAAQAAGDRLFANFAGTVLKGLNAASVESLPANNGYGAPRIVVRTLGGDSPEIAAAYTRRMLRALQTRAKGQFGFVALDAMDRLIRDIKAEDLSTDATNARIRDLRINARADILVAGTLRRRNGETLLSYQAINPETGALLASTAARPVTMLTRDQTPEYKVAAPTRRRGDGYRPTVEEVERLLLEKGYDPGAVDGYMTGETRAALRRYQQDSALPLNGRLTRRVVNNLRRDTRAAAY